MGEVCMDAVKKVCTLHAALALLVFLFPSVTFAQQSAGTDSGTSVPEVGGNVTTAQARDNGQTEIANTVASSSASYTTQADSYPTHLLLHRATVLCSL